MHLLGRVQYTFMLCLVGSEGNRILPSHQISAIGIFVVCWREQAEPRFDPRLGPVWRVPGGWRPVGRLLVIRLFGSYVVVNIR